MNKKQQRQQKMLRQQEIVNAARNAGRDLTADEQTEFDSLQREIERLNGEIDAEERQAQANANPANAPPAANPQGEADTQRAVTEERDRIRSITSQSPEWKQTARFRMACALGSSQSRSPDHILRANGHLSCKSATTLTAQRDKPKRRIVSEK